ncbi:MAG TPA: hypothetical protein VIV60_18865 [Polyangiaceae bacterium]
MTQVRWSTRGVGVLAGLEGIAVLRDRDVLPVSAALRDLQRRSGLEVTAVGSSGTVDASLEGSGDGHAVSSCSIRRRVYSVRLRGSDQRSAACMLSVETLEESTFELGAAVSA